MFKTTQLLKSFAIAASLAAVPSLAHAEERTFLHEGTSYTYSTSDKNGHRLIRGRSSDGKAFRLIVGSKSVEGTFDGAPVSFSLSEVKRLAVAMR